MKFLSMQSSTPTRISLENLDLEIQNDEINSSTSSMSLHSNSNSSIDDDLTSLSWLIEFNKTSSTFPDSIIKPILEPDQSVDLGSCLNNEKKTDEHLSCNSYFKRKYLNSFSADLKLPNSSSKLLKSVKNVSLKLNSPQNIHAAGQQIKRTNRKQSAMDRFNNFIEQVKKTKIEYDLQSDSYLIDSVNKPPFNYSQIIGMAMIENGQMTLQQICNWIQTKFCYYRKRSNWNNSIRHNLSLQFCFRKIDRNKYEKGKGGYWELAMDLKKSERKRIRNRKSTANKCKSTDQLNRNQNKIQNINCVTNLENKNESNKCLPDFPNCTVLSQIIFNSIEELPVPLNKYKTFSETSKNQVAHNEIENSIQLIESNGEQNDQNRSIVIDSQEISNAYNEILKNLDVTEDELNGALYSNQNTNLILHNNLNEDFTNSKCETKQMSNYVASKKTFLTTDEQNIRNQILDEKNVIVSSYLNNLKPINGPNVIVESLPILYSTFLTRTKSDDKNEIASNFTVTSSPSSISSNSNSEVLSSSVCCSCYNCSCCTLKNTNNNCNNSEKSVVAIVESQMNQEHENGVLDSVIGSCNNCSCCTRKNSEINCNNNDQNSVVAIIESQMNQENDEELIKEHESLAKCNLNCEFHQETFLLNQNIQQNLLRPFLDNIDEAFNLLRDSEIEYRSCDDLLDGIYDISVNDF